jgi:hypothetical protein
VALLFLFTSWLPFVLVLPWARRVPALRGSWVAVGVGVAAATYTLVTLRLWPGASIRVDLLLVMAVLAASEVVAWLLLVGALAADRRRRTLPARGRAAGWIACAAVGAWLAAGALGVVQMTVSGRALMTRHRQGQGLLLEAALRDRERAAIAYGDLEPDPLGTTPWVGVWELEATTARLRTLVVTAQGRVWLRFECGLPECEAGPGTLEGAAGSPAVARVPGPGGGTWEVRLAPALAGHLRVAVQPPGATGGGALEATARRRLLPAAQEEPGELESLGAFSSLEALPAHLALTELRLWRRGGSIHGLALCQIALPGSLTHLRPQVFAAELSTDGSSFTLPVDRCRGTVRIVPDGLELTGRDPRSRQAERTVLLRPGARVRDAALDLTPDSTLEAWREWTEVVIRPILDWRPPSAAPEGAALLDARAGSGAST